MKPRTKRELANVALILVALAVTVALGLWLATGAPSAR